MLNTNTYYLLFLKWVGTCFTIYIMMKPEGVEEDSFLNSIPSSKARLSQNTQLDNSSPASNIAKNVQNDNVPRRGQDISHSTHPNTVTSSHLTKSKANRSMFSWNFRDAVCATKKSNEKKKENGTDDDNESYMEKLNQRWDEIRVNLPTRSEVRSEFGLLSSILAVLRRSC